MKIYGNWGLFYARVPNDLAARALSADAGISRADYFDAGLTQPVPDGVLALGTTSHFLQPGVSRRHDRSRRQVELRQRSRRRLRVRGAAGHEPRRALHPSRHSARARGRAAVPDRRLRSRHSRRDAASTTRSRIPARTRRRPAISARPSRRRSTATTRSSSRPTGASPTTGRCWRRIATRGCAAPSRASTATTTGSRIPASRRSSTSRPTIRATRRSASRSSAIAATSVSSARSARDRCRSIGRTRSSSTATISSRSA